MICSVPMVVDHLRHILPAQSRPCIAICLTLTHLFEQFDDRGRVPATYPLSMGVASLRFEM